MKLLEYLTSSLSRGEETINLIKSHLEFIEKTSLKEESVVFYISKKKIALLSNFTMDHSYKLEANIVYVEGDKFQISVVDVNDIIPYESSCHLLYGK